MTRVRPPYACVLAAARRHAGLTQQQLAGRLNRSPSYIRSVENGQQEPDKDYFIVYARKLGADPANLMVKIEVQTAEEATRRSNPLSQVKQRLSRW